MLVEPGRKSRLSIRRLTGSRVLSPLEAAVSAVSVSSQSCRCSTECNDTWTTTTWRPPAPETGGPRDNWDMMRYRVGRTGGRGRRCKHVCSSASTSQPQSQARRGGGGSSGSNDLPHRLHGVSLCGTGVHGGAPGLEALPGPSAGLQELHAGLSDAEDGGAEEEDGPQARKQLLAPHSWLRLLRLHCVCVHQTGNVVT